MWNTSEGVRVLQGDEWELFRTGVDVLWDDIEEGFRGLPVESGIDVFDAMQPSQQLAVLADIADALNDQDIEPPSLTAVNESAIAAVFDAIRGYLSCEIEMDPDVSQMWRRLLLAAFLTTKYDKSEPIPNETCADLDEWTILLECMEQEILWDNDFEADAHADLDPTTAARVKADLGIDPDYFSAIPPDPRESELDAIRARLRRRTGRRSNI
jgi:hypothetical protein